MESCVVWFLVRIIAITTTILWIHRTVFVGAFSRSTIYPAFTVPLSFNSHPRVKQLFSGKEDYDNFEETSFAKRQDSAASPQPYWEGGDFDWNEYDNMPDSVNPQDFLEPDVLQWEKCATSAGTAWVLLPPPSVSQPTCIVHFVGGTFMGSAPNVWYRTLLQDIVRHTSCAVIATSIPVTISQSPLNHVRLSQQLLQQFRIAYRDVLVDEYGSEVLQLIPLCGIGHSLGARLLTVLATTTLGKVQVSPPSSRESFTTLTYKSYVLISFTNYGAAAGIPGVAQLFRQSRRLERQKQQEMEPGGAADDREWDDDNDDEDFSELWQELTDFVQAGATRVQKALTPPSKALEFHPNPEQLWAAIQQDQRYTIPQTLIVQFDDDEIDQSAQFATSIVNCSDTKFARLRGTHLTPVSFVSHHAGDKDENRSFLEHINSRAGRLLFQLFRGRQQLSHQESLRELRQSIARYITEVVTKP
jgi:Protein of unknown function (DUF1350)